MQNMPRHRILRILVAATAAMAVAASAAAGERQSVRSATEGEWLTLTGSVVTVRGDRFMLDYGRDTIAVEMDDLDWRKQNVLDAGDRVTVSGRMDADFFDERKIEARSVYVGSKGEVHYASIDDEEESVHVPLLHELTRKERVRDQPKDDEWVQFTGAVTRIGAEAMTLDVGRHQYEVDTSGLAYDRFDAGSARRIRIGDRVIVFGRMDDGDLFEDRRIEASTVTKLSGVSN